MLLSADFAEVLMVDAQDVRAMDNKTLHHSNVRVAETEREITQRLLVQLRETERRRMYLEYSCGSLHEYCTKILKYSNGAAGRRVNASRLLDAVPEVSEKVVDGSVNLSTLSMAQSFIHAEEKRTKQKFSQEQRREVVNKIENLSQDEALKTLIEAMPQADVHTSSTRPLIDNETLIKFIADRKFLGKYERVRELNSHKPEFLNIKGLFEGLLDEHLDRYAPERKKPKETKKNDSKETERSKETKQAKTNIEAANPESAEANSQENDEKNSTQSSTAAVSPDVKVERKTYYDNETDRQLYAKSGGQCQHTDENGVRCPRRYHLQRDHIIPLSKGGTNDISNLQHLCRPHNLQKGNRLRSPVVAYAC
jgi:5-methylcytosine-specific restriction protein A